MNNFTFHNPTRIVFGKGSVTEIGHEVAADDRVFLLYGGGSIRRNGVYDTARTKLGTRIVGEQGGIEPNPQYRTCLRAAAAAREAKATLLLAAGGGSVIDAAKFIAAAITYAGDDPWRLVTGEEKIVSALPIASILTLPATGSEMNANSVISRAEIEEKRGFGSRHFYPRFSILDPLTTMTLPPRYIANGVVDAYVHVVEQYLTYSVNSPIQDRFAEGILMTLVEEGPRALATPDDYDVRANIMWASTVALNGFISVGVVQDWATHSIGHEITALYGVDHARTLAIALPGVWKHELDHKRARLAQYGRRVWSIAGSDAEVAPKAIARTEEFFASLGIGTTLAAHDVPRDAAARIGERIGKRGWRLGEHQSIDGAAVTEILSTQAGTPA